MDGFDADFFAPTAASVTAPGGGSNANAPTTGAGAGDGGFAGFDMGDFDFGAPTTADSVTAPVGSAMAAPHSEGSIPAHMGDAHGSADPWGADLSFPQPASVPPADAETASADPRVKNDEAAPATKPPPPAAPIAAPATGKGHVSFAVPPPPPATESQVSSVHHAAAAATPSGPNAAVARPQVPAATASTTAAAHHSMVRHAHQHPPQHPHLPQQRPGLATQGGGPAKPMPGPDVNKAMRNMEEALRMTAGAADPSPNEAADFDDDVAAIEAGFAKLSDDVTDAAATTVAAVIDQAGAMGPCELGTFLGHPKASFHHLLPLIIAELRTIQ